MKQFLKRINSLPIPLTMKHYFPFDETTAQLVDGKLDSAASWDVLRQSHPHFSIATDRAEWLKAAELQVRKDGQDGGLIRRAHDVVEVIDDLGVTSVFSVGVGGAGLEYQIKKLRPEVRLTCSEYSPVAVGALKKVFTEAESIVLFDMKKDDWKRVIQGVDPKKQLCLMYRIDIDLSNSDLDTIFKKMHIAGIENVLLVMCGRLTLRGIVNRLAKRLKWMLTGVRYAFAGYVRTETKLQNAWRGLYETTPMDCGGLRSFLLRKRS